MIVFFTLHNTKPVSPCSKQIFFTRRLQCGFVKVLLRWIVPQTHSPSITYTPKCLSLNNVTKIHQKISCARSPSRNTMNFHSNCLFTQNESKKDKEMWLILISHSSQNERQESNSNLSFRRVTRRGELKALNFCTNFDWAKVWFSIQWGKRVKSEWDFHRNK